MLAHLLNRACEFFLDCEIKQRELLSNGDNLNVEVFVGDVQWSVLRFKQLV
jgi:hypothetical protein